MEEDQYIPLVKEWIHMQKQYDKPSAAATAIAKQANKKPAASKPRAKAKSKAD